jgi:hypothetical protein
MDLGVILTAAGAVSAVALYVIRAEMRGDVSRLDGRINTHEAACEQRQKKLDERHEHISQGMERIEANISALVDKLL